MGQRLKKKKTAVWGMESFWKICDWFNVILKCSEGDDDCCTFLWNFRKKSGFLIYSWIQTSYAKILRERNEQQNLSGWKTNSLFYSFSDTEFLNVLNLHLEISIILRAFWCTMYSNKFSVYTFGSVNRPLLTVMHEAFPGKARWRSHTMKIDIRPVRKVRKHGKILWSVS